MESATTAPVKTVLELQAGQGDAADVEAWIRDALAAAARIATLQGSSVLTSRDRYFVLLRFATQADHDRWRSSDEVVELMRRGEAFVSRDPPVERSGFETWFALPGRDAGAGAPAKWKMALVTWCALLPQIVALSFVVPKSLPFLVNVAVSTAIPVCMLTWIVMPRVTRLLEAWLYARDARR